MAYTNSPLIDYTILSPNNSGVRTHAIDTITIHCMAGNLTAQNCGAWFSKPSAKASSNYGIDSEGKIALYVPESNRSWCSSNGVNDNRAVTIEVANITSCEPYICTDAAYDALINLVTDICKRNGIEKLVWSDSKNDRINHLNGCNMTVHRDFANKSCPGTWLYTRQGQIAAEVNARLVGETEKAAPVFAEPKLYEVITQKDPLNCRESPSSLSAITGTFAKSEVLIGDSDAVVNGAIWVHVTNGATTGWASGKYLAEVEQSEEITPAEEMEDEMYIAGMLEKMSLEQAAVIGDMEETYRAKLPESEWARPEFEQAVKLGITDGTRPKAHATREEMACENVRVYELIEKRLNKIDKLLEELLETGKL